MLKMNKLVGDAWKNDLDGKLDFVKQSDFRGGELSYFCFFSINFNSI